jgi:hypothetical protein
LTLGSSSVSEAYRGSRRRQDINLKKKKAQCVSCVTFAVFQNVNDQLQVTVVAVEFQPFLNLSRKNIETKKNTITWAKKCAYAHVADY